MCVCVMECVCVKECVHVVQGVSVCEDCSVWHELVSSVRPGALTVQLHTVCGVRLMKCAV